MNYNYLVALFNWKRNSTPKGKNGVLCIKLILTTLGIIMTTVFLWKIYEVPVYHTNIGICHNTDSIHISVKLVRDFDLHSHISKDTSMTEWKYGFHTGYLSVYGFAYLNKMDSFKPKNTAKMTKTVEQNLRSVLDQNLRDSGAYHFIDSVKNIVYIQISGTERQFFRFKNYVNEPEFKYEKDCDLIYKGDSVRQRWYCRYSGINSKMPHGTFMTEDIYTSGEHDDSTMIEYIYYASTFDSPSFFMTAEDYSKIIEDVHFEDLEAKDIHKLDIDYKGVAEFGILLPEPDSMSISSIHYFTSEKINKIVKYGLKYQVRFPELENMQEIRIFFATMILAGLLGVFFNLLYRLLRQRLYRLWITKSDNIISLVFFASVILLAIIVYFVFVSRSASSVQYGKESKPLTELSIEDT